MRARFFTSLILVAFCASPSVAAPLVGVVLHAESDLPIVGATVRVTANPHAVQTDASGRFSFLDLPAEPVLLTVTHVAFEAHTRMVTLGDEIEVLLSPKAIPLEDLAVVARPDSIGARPSAFAVVLQRAEFEGRVTSLAEILSRTTGVHVRSLGGLGAFSTISLRGSSSEQVDVYLDGIRLNSALGGGVNLSNLPLSHIGQIEIQRGAGQDGSGLGGTVQIRTRDLDDNSRHGLFASWGSFDTRVLNATLSVGSGRLRSLVVADYAESDNNFSFLDNNGTEFNLDDDDVTARRNSDSLSGSVLLKARLTLTEARSLTFHQTLYARRQGIPGISNNQSAEARFNTLRSLSELVYEDRSFLGKASSRHALFFTQVDEAFRDEAGEVGVGRQDNQDRTRTFGWRMGTQLPLAIRHLVSINTEVARETFDPTAHIRLITPLFAARRSRIGAVGRADVGLPGDRGVWSVRIDARHLRNRLEDRNPSAFSPQSPDSIQNKTLLSVSSGIRVDIDPTLALKANVGRPERAPSFFELFGDRGGVVGNIRLKPERAKTWDAGFRYTIQHGYLEAAYFDHRYDELIQFFQTSQATSRPHNIGRARVHGLESTGALSLGPVVLSANYTLQEAVDRSDIPSQRGNQLPNRPRHELAAAGTGRLGRLALRYDYAFEDGNFLDRANRRALAPRHIHGFSVHVEARFSLRFGIEARNITNAQVNDVWGYPLPGRAWFISVRSGS